MSDLIIHTIKVKGEDYLIRDSRVDNLEEQVTTSEIKVGGTPLGEYLKDNGIDKIDSGNLQEVLTSLFSLDKYPTGYKRFIPDNLNVSMNKPTIEKDSGNTVEVGSTVTFTFKPSEASASGNITYTGFDYGYSKNNDSTKDGDTPDTIQITGKQDTGSKYKLSFNNPDFPERDIDYNETVSQRLIIGKGDNTITVTATAPSFTGTVQKINDIYACSSLGNTSDNEKISGTGPLEIKSSEKEATNEVTIKGEYYAFIGYSKTVPTTNDEFRKYIGNGLTRLGKGGSLNGTCDNAFMFICIPDDWDFTCDNEMELSIRDAFKDKDVKDIKITLPNNSEMDYKCYSMENYGGKFKNLTIK